MTKLLLLLDRLKSDKITISPTRISVEGGFAIIIFFVLALILLFK